MVKTRVEPSLWRKEKLDPIRNSPAEVLKVQTMRELYRTAWRQVLRVTSMFFPEGRKVQERCLEQQISHRREAAHPS